MRKKEEGNSMSAPRHWFAGATIALTSSSLLAAGSAQFVAWNGTEVNIASGEFVDILENSGNAFSLDDMNRVNEELQSQGISTQDKINVFLTETAAGLTIVTMLGGVETPDSSGPTTAVSTTAFVPGTAGWQYNADAGGSFDAVPLGDTTVLSGLFQWESGVNSAAMAASNLAVGDTGSYQFNEFQQGGLSTNNTIQLLTSEGGVWSVAQSFDFDPAEDGGLDFQYFDFAITDIPAPGGLVIMMFAANGLRRRRR
tara:strand:+ start:627 stop:1391 length:765 start_codon:yes stop_codon:yes gene_type:complete